MEGIQGFLGRYLHLAPPDGVVRKALATALKEALNIDVSERRIKIVGTVAYIETDTTTKSVLFMQQQRLLSLLEEKLGKKSLTAIR